MAEMMGGRRARTTWLLPLLLALPLLLLLLLPLLFSVTEFHHRPTSDTHAKKRKFDHLVFGPPAGEGLPDRLHCKGLKALNKTCYSISSSTKSSKDSVSFVTVFTAYNTSLASGSHDKELETFSVGNTSYSKLEKAMAILDAFISFIQISMPQSNIFILSDPASDLSVKKEEVQLIHIPGNYARDRLMLQRIKSYIAFLDARYKEKFLMKNHANHYIFTDSDIAVVDDLGDIFQKYPGFDVALTFRNNRDQPLNSGFIAVRGTTDGILKAKILLEEVLQIYLTKFMKASRMLGDQLALASLVKSSPSFNPKRFTKPRAFMDTVHGASLLFLPCAVYNWTPPEGAGQFHGMPLDIKVVHFKGSRKRLMLEAWNYFRSSGSSDYSDMLCLILRSGRTKYHIKVGHKTIACRLPRIALTKGGMSSTLTIRIDMFIWLINMVDDFQFGLL